jgi:hypothetical protein
MSTSSEKETPPPPSLVEEEIIELVEVVEDPHQETVLELTVEDEDLDSLGLPGRAAPKDLPGKPPKVVEEGQEESLDDFLASLPELPEDLAAAAGESAPKEVPAPEVPPISEVLPAPEPPPAPEAPPPVAAVSPEGLHQQVESALNPEELQAMVREVVQETVEKLARELFPQVAAEVLDQHLAALKKRLLEGD